jgi:cytochrome c biogenesis protein CcmG/thiol:disulfide interchange protein DsbE
LSVKLLSVFIVVGSLLGTNVLRVAASVPVTNKKFQISDFKGKMVLLDFWATWCGPCVMETPYLISLYKKYKDRGFTVVGVSMDDAGEDVVKSFVKRFEIPYPIYINGDSTPLDAYPVFGLPTTFLIDRDGRILRKYVGFAPPEIMEDDVKSVLDNNK